MEVLHIAINSYFAYVLYTSDIPEIKTEWHTEGVVMAFIIVGFLLSVMEVMNLYRELYGKHKRSLIDLMNLMTSWLDDVPQIVIAAYVAFKMKRTLSWIQYAKAGFAMFETILQAVGFTAYIYLIRKEQKYFMYTCILEALSVFVIMSAAIMICLQLSIG